MLNKDKITNKINKKLEKSYISPQMVTDRSRLYCFRWFNGIKQSKFVYRNLSLLPKKGGKWLIFIKTEMVDSVWPKIKAATQLGYLGHMSSVSTAMPSTYGGSKTVISVYCKTGKYKHILKIRDMLTLLGFTHSLPYKTNLATLKGIYYSKNRRVSEYYI